jgi:hypothetical protein
MNNKYKLYADRVIADHNRYYFTRNVKQDIYITLEKANNLQKILKNKINEELENGIHCAICLESMQQKSIVQTSCNHTFCLKCVEQNKHCNKFTGNLCTICRKDIFT